MLISSRLANSPPLALHHVDDCIDLPAPEECFDADTHYGAKDSAGNTCAWYFAHTSQCGSYDHSDFLARALVLLRAPCRALHM